MMKFFHLLFPSGAFVICFILKLAILAINEISCSLGNQTYIYIYIYIHAFITSWIKSQLWHIVVGTKNLFAFAHLSRLYFNNVWSCQGEKKSRESFWMLNSHKMSTKKATHGLNL
jgi:hypothetical protein